MFRAPLNGWTNINTFKPYTLKVLIFRAKNAHVWGPLDGRTQKCSFLKGGQRTATKPETHKGPAKGPGGIDRARDSRQSHRDSSQEAQTETQTADRAGRDTGRQAAQGLRIIGSNIGFKYRIMRPNMRFI